MGHDFTPKGAMGSQHTVKTDEWVARWGDQRAQARQKLVRLHHAVCFAADGFSQLVDNLAAARDGEPFKTERSAGAIADEPFSFSRGGCGDTGVDVELTAARSLGNGVS